MPKPTPPPAATNPNKPVHTVRHRNIKAAIWKNETGKGPMYNITVSRSYREGEQWHDSHSFGYDDLMNLAKVLYDAHSYITALRSKPANRPPAKRKEQATQPQS